MRDEQQKDRDNGRVTRRGGTRIYGSSTQPREAERIRAFDDDRDTRESRRYRDEDDRYERDYRDSRRYRDDDDRDIRGSRRYRDEDDRYERDYRDGRRYRDDDDRDTRERRRYRDEDDRYERDYRESRRYRDDDDRDYRESRRYRDGDDRRKRDSGRREAPRGADKPRAPKPKEPSRVSAPNTELFAHQVVPYVMFWVALFAAASFILRDIAGLSASAGIFGNWLADFLCGLLGIGAYLLPLFLVVLSLRWKRFVREGILGKKLFLSTSFLLLLSGIIHVFQDADRARRVTESAILYAEGVAREGSGFFGGFVGELLGFCLRLPGTCLLAIPLLVIIGIYLVGLTPSGLWNRIDAKLKIKRRPAREERSASGTRATPTAKRTHLPSAEEPAALGWKEPRPLSRSGNSYDFREDEPDVAIEEPVIKREESVAPATSAPAAQSPSYQRRTAEVNDILDIPDDEPLIEEPSAEAKSILSGAGHTTDTDRQVEEILREMERAATEAPKAAPAQKEERGDYYAPFALPVRPEPRRDRVSTPAVEAEIDRVADEPSLTVPEDVSFEGDLEEILGNTEPAPRVERTPFAPVFEQKAPTPPTENTFAAQDEVPSDPFAVDEIFENVGEITTDNAGSMLADLFEEPEENGEIADSFTAQPIAEPAAPSFEEPSFEEPSFEEPVSWAQEPFAPAAEPEVKEAPTVEIPAVREPVTEAPRPTFSPAFSTPVAPQVQTPAVTATPVKDEAPAPVVHRPYTRPHVGLLAIDQNIRTSDFYEEIEDTKLILRDTLESFNIHIQDQISYSHGPSVTRYELRPVAGTSVRSVTNRIDDIALNLAASVRIEAPIPGKPAIGVEVPNKVRETVYMRTMLESDEYRTSTKPLEVPLGLDVGGAVRMCNLAAMPHLLIAGTTGSGKSVCINSILLSLIFKTSPEDLRLILIDPKQIEFAPYEHVPHLYMPIVTDMQRAAGALACAVQEMERRFSLIRDVGVRNIEAYNDAVKNDPDREHLPYIIIVIDEFADLKMSVANNDPENFTCRIAQKARAAGIHLIIGTQRPSVDVITGKLKTNIPSRIAFMVKQQVDSRTILDINGAESLTGRGDMLYMASNSQDKAPVRVQGAYVSDKELEDVIGYVRANNDPVQYNRAFMDQIEIEVARAQNSGKKGDIEDFGEMESADGEDPKFVDAVKLAIETQKVATSLLQRRLGVGYGRAAKIIDRMEELGLVSAPDGNKPRQILPAAQGYLNHLGQEEEDGVDDFNDYQ